MLQSPLLEGCTLAKPGTVQAVFLAARTPLVVHEFSHSTQQASRVLARKDVESEDEIAAESLADRLAAGIRGSAFAETSYTEIFG